MRIQEDIRRSRADYPFWHTRPKREQILEVACPVCEAKPQKWCRRKGIGKDLKDTARNRLLMAERTPPSHDERKLLWQTGRLPAPDYKRKHRRSRTRLGKRERAEALIGIPPLAPVPDPVRPAWMADRTVILSGQEIDALPPYELVAYLYGDDGEAPC